MQKNTICISCAEIQHFLFAHETNITAQLLQPSSKNLGWKSKRIQIKLNLSNHAKNFEIETNSTWNGRWRTCFEGNTDNILQKWKSSWFQSLLRNWRSNIKKWLNLERQPFQFGPGLNFHNIQLLARFCHGKDKMYHFRKLYEKSGCIMISVVFWEKSNNNASRPLL